jgi:CheY-like chemotaxis protein
VEAERKKVAIVEDSPEVRMLVTVLLSRAWEVDEYKDGEEALAGLAESPPDLVLLDISLPGIDGTEVLARMRAKDPPEHPAHAARLAKIPVIAFTGYSSDDERQRLLDLGFDDYIGKPITDFQLLMDVVERLLSR